GCLSTANIPDLEGMDSFEGPIYHTGRWPHEEVDFTGKRVAVVGTGSSGIQGIPVIAEQAAAPTPFQRPANYSIPAGNGPIAQDLVAEIKADYAGFRARNSERPAAVGSRYPVVTTSVFEASDDERDEAFSARWEAGGFGFMGAFGDLA